MIAVLIASCKPGRSSWSAVRGRKTVRVRGMTDGDSITISGRGKLIAEFSITVTEDADIQVPDSCDQVAVEHIETSGSLVYVDLK